MPFDLNPWIWDTWELNPSTRTSYSLWTKWVPVSSTLTTPGTAQDLYLINPEYPTVNIATNPSFETGSPPTGYTAVGSALAQSAVIARSGSNSLLINPDNLAAGEGAFWTTPESLGGPTEGAHVIYLVASAYFNDNAGSGSGARIVITDTNGVTLANGNTLTLDATWQRSVARIALSQTAASYRVYFVTSAQHNTNFYVDSFQAELSKSGNASAYCDGSLGNFYEWDSTANASMSRRRGGLVAIRGYTLYNTRNMYIAYDQTASSSLGKYTRAGTDFWNDHPVHIKHRISFINELAGEAPRVYGELWGVHLERAA